MRKRALLPTDPGLFARMVIAAVMTPLIVLLALVVVVAAAPPKVTVFVFIACAIGLFGIVSERRAIAPTAPVPEAEAPELHAIVERLCLLADVPKPALVVEPARMPNSWVAGTGAGRYRLHLTRGLLDRLDPRELEAVVAHELAHVANHDAAVMTIVGGPSAMLLGGGRKLLRGGWFGMMAGAGLAFGIGWLSSFGTRALSRYREFAADAGSVALTGSGAALASALMKVSEGIGAIPERDLRVAAARDAFHLLPVGDDKLHLPPTHPSLQERIARLEKLEHALQRR